APPIYVHISDIERVIGIVGFIIFVVGDSEVGRSEVNDEERCSMAISARTRTQPSSRAQNSRCYPMTGKFPRRIPKQNVLFCYSACVLSRSPGIFMDLNPNTSKSRPGPPNFRLRKKGDRIVLAMPGGYVGHLRRSEEGCRVRAAERRQRSLNGSESSESLEAAGAAIERVRAMEAAATEGGREWHQYRAGRGAG